jgi:hypothetical protein
MEKNRLEKTSEDNDRIIILLSDSKGNLTPICSYRYQITNETHLGNGLYISN